METDASKRAEGPVRRQGTGGNPPFAPRPAHAGEDGVTDATPEGGGRLPKPRHPRNDGVPGEGPAKSEPNCSKKT